MTQSLVISEYLFENLYFVANPHHPFVELNSALQERKCHPLHLAILYSYFCESRGMRSSLLRCSHYQFVKIAHEDKTWIIDLSEMGKVLANDKLLRYLSIDPHSQQLEPFDERTLREQIYQEIVYSHRLLEDWENVIKTLKLRELEFSDSPKDFAIYAQAHEKLNRKAEAFHYLNRYFSFTPQSEASKELLQTYQSLRFDQIESLLSKPEFRPFEI